MNYDIIGDIHGHAEALKALLAAMGYRERGGAWCHSERMALLVGDLIDRGPGQIETVDVVRRMVDAGTALAVMGNHEFNAIGWHLEDGAGGHLRPHSKKNRTQHQAFLDAAAGTAAHEAAIDWFLTLPLWLDLPEVALVHACWHPPFMDYLEPRLASGRRLTRELMPAASQEPEDDSEKDTLEPTVFKAVEAIVKGLEIPLPEGHSFVDKDGHVRRRVRVRWWDGQARTYRQAAILDEATRGRLPEIPIPERAVLDRLPDKPTFIGHYWLTGKPQVLSANVACVDYSVARDGKLVAYRWDGETELSESKFFWLEP